MEYPSRVRTDAAIEAVVSHFPPASGEVMRQLLKSVIAAVATADDALPLDHVIQTFTLRRVGPRNFELELDTLDGADKVQPDYAGNPKLIQGRRSRCILSDDQ